MQSTPKPGENFWLWFTKILSGVLIVVILGIHLTVNHFLAPHGLLSHADVVAYFQNPLVVLMEGAFLLLLVTHSLLGLRGILLDLNPPQALLRAVDVLLVAFGVGVLLYGWRLLFIVRAMGG